MNIKLNFLDIIFGWKVSKESKHTGKTYKIAETAQYLAGQEFTVISTVEEAMEEALRLNPLSFLIRETNAKQFDRINYLLKCYAARFNGPILKKEVIEHKLLIGTIGTLEFIVHQDELIIPSES